MTNILLGIIVTAIGAGSLLIGDPDLLLDSMAIANVWLGGVLLSAGVLQASSRSL